MSADRELLKLAANAAGMRWVDDRKTGLTIQRPEGNGIYNFHWNPLAYDGDALRLAVKLRLDIRGSMALASFRYVTFEGVTYAESDADNPCAATRRAIVRAAAEIGRSLK